MKPPCVRTRVARLQRLQKAQTLARIIDLERIIRSTRKTRDPRLPAFLVALPFIFLLSLIVGSICFECLSFNNTDWRCVLFIVIVNMIVTAQYQAGEQDARDSNGLRFTFLGFDADEDLNASPSRAQLRPTCHKRTLTSSPLFESENIDDVQSDALDDLELRLLSVSCTRAPNIPGPEISNETHQGTEPKVVKNDAPCMKCAPSPRGLACIQRIRADREPENIQRCVHARLCASFDAVGMIHGVIVSASVEMNDGMPCLQIWRGHETLASMTLSSLRVATPYECMIELAPKSSSGGRRPVCFLVFEDETSTFHLLRQICTQI